MITHKVGRVRYYYDPILKSWGVFIVDAEGVPTTTPDGGYTVKYFFTRVAAETYVHTICDCRRTI